VPLVSQYSPNSRTHRGFSAQGMSIHPTLDEPATNPKKRSHKSPSYVPRYKYLESPARHTPQGPNARSLVTGAHAFPGARERNSGVLAGIYLSRRRASRRIYFHHPQAPLTHHACVRSTTNCAHPCATTAPRRKPQLRAARRRCGATLPGGHYFKHQKQPRPGPLSFRVLPRFPSASLPGQRTITIGLGPPPCSILIPITILLTHRPVCY